MTTKKRPRSLHKSGASGPTHNRKPTSRINNRSDERTTLELIWWARDVEGISPAAHHLLLLLVTYADRQFESFPHKTLLADKLNVSEKYIRMLRAQLRDAGLIDYQDGRHTVYVITPTWKPISMETSFQGVETSFHQSGTGVSSGRGTRKKDSLKMEKKKEKKKSPIILQSVDRFAGCFSLRSAAGASASAQSSCTGKSSAISLRASHNGNFIDGEPNLQAFIESGLNANDYQRAVEELRNGNGNH